MIDKSKLNNSEQSFHTNRRAFIIMHDGRGLVLEPKGSDLSHKQMFENIGLGDLSVQYCLETYPRGYFMDDELCVYQGCDMTPGNKWELSQQNYAIVRQYMPKLQRVFNLNDNSNLYLGVLVGAIGSIWDKINKTTISDFMCTR